ncbi:hypothetical protein ASPTUDRAFT_137487, partial [Aspergillus tubingensis CBS 134.48]
LNGCKIQNTVSGYLYVCSLLPNAQGHILTLNKEQTPKPPPQMTMHVFRALARRREGPSQRRRHGKKSSVGMGRAKMCVTHEMVPLVNRCLKYTTILGKQFQI